MAGRRIDDHHSWIGPSGKNVPFPDGAKMKQTSSEEGFGSLMHYEDTDEAIKAQQAQNKAKVHGHPHKPGTRN